MAQTTSQRVIGHALLGLAIGVLLFTVFYLVTYREGIAKRYEWGWVAIHLSMLLGPAVLLGLWGANQKPAA